MCWVGLKLGRSVNSVVPKNDSHPTFRIRIKHNLELDRPLFSLIMHIPKTIHVNISVFSWKLADLENKNSKIRWAVFMWNIIVKPKQSQWTFEIFFNIHQI